MARMLKVQYGEGGAYPPSWTDLPHTYRVQLDYYSNHPSQLEVECGSSGGTPPALLSCIRVLDPDYGNDPLFSGRIDEVKPIHTTNVGHIWQLRARDFLAALADNTVGHPMPNGGFMPIDAWSRRVPNWREAVPGINSTGCRDGQDPGGQCGVPRYYVVYALAMSPRHAFTGFYYLGEEVNYAGDYIAPDYLHTPTKSILQVIQELCNGASWLKIPYRVRSGWDFRQSMGTMQRFVVFPRGRLWWDESIRWAWKEHGANRVTITDYQVFDHAYDVYTRAYAMGTGEASGLEGNPTLHSYGIVDPDTDSESAARETTWAPTYGRFRVQRDASEVRVGETDKDALTKDAKAKLEGDGYDDYYRGRKMTLTTVGIPRTAFGGLPLPGYRIFVQGIPGVEAQSFVISRWSYSAPEGVTRVDLGLPLNDAGLKLSALQNVARQGISGQHWVGPWWSTLHENVGSSDYQFYHHMGVVPRNVYVQIAKINTARPYGCSNSGQEMDDRCPFAKTISKAAPMYREEDGRWVGYAVMRSDRDAIRIRWAHFMGYSQGEAAGSGDPSRGWLELGWDTAFRIIVEA